MDSHATSWAEEEFAGAELGDERRRQRLIDVARAVAESPGGRITCVFPISSEREGAFRFVENDAVDPAAIGRAAHAACADRSRGQRFVYVPIDGSSLNISDWQRAKGLGTVGARWVGATGLQVMSAIGVAPDGTPLGICGQSFWTRTERVVRKRKDKRPVEQKETRYWLELMHSVRNTYAASAPETKPWFQLDRGGDCRDVLQDAVRSGHCVTIRAARNRRLWRKNKEARRYLWNVVTRLAVRTTIALQVPGGAKRVARQALLDVRFAPVCLDLHNVKGKSGRPALLWAVHVREQWPAPRGEKAIEWMLLTTVPVLTVEDALKVVHGYSERWSIEEFHRTWKSGACHVETTQLRACDHIVRWATILASVAMRIQRLTKLARTQPDLPATVELKQGEIDAVIAHHPKAKAKYRRGDAPTISEAVNWLAEIGGYTGKSSGGPPGATVVARGLDKIQLLAAYLAGELGEK